MYFLLSEVSPSCLHSIMNPFQIRSKQSWAHNAFCCSLLIVFAQRKTKWTWNPERIHFFLSPWEWKWEPYGRTELTKNKCGLPLNSPGELVCMHQWLTGSWAPDNHPLLQELLLRCWQWLSCIAAETHSMLSPLRCLVVPKISWWCKFFRKWRWAILWRRGSRLIGDQNIKRMS